jgi:hypothetical protein
MKRALCAVQFHESSVFARTNEESRRTERAAFIHVLYLWLGAATAAKAGHAGAYVAPTCRWMLQYCGFVILKFGGNKSSSRRNGSSVRRSVRCHCPRGERPREVDRDSVLQADGEVDNGLMKITNRDLFGLLPHIESSLGDFQKRKPGRNRRDVTSLSLTSRAPRASE